MPRPPAPKPGQTHEKTPHANLERRSYLGGLFTELEHQVSNYQGIVSDWCNMLGRIEISERLVRATRDNLAQEMSRSNEEVPPNWREVLDCVRFVGMRTADAALAVLVEREGHRMTTDDLLRAIDDGGFRFNSPFPLRELNAAMLRHPRVKREGDEWVYTPPPPRAVKPKKEVTVSKVA